MRRALSLLALGLLAAAAASCDWEHYALMNSLPARGDPDRNPVVHVYLGLDGLGHRAVVHVRTPGRLSAVSDLTDRGAELDRR